MMSLNHHEYNKMIHRALNYMFHGEDQEKLVLQAKTDLHQSLNHHSQELQVQLHIQFHLDQQIQYHLKGQVNNSYI